MNTVDTVRLRVIVCRIEELERNYAVAMKRLQAEKELLNWMDSEMSDLWIEKAALERKGGYMTAVSFT